MNSENRFNIFEELRVWCPTLESWEQLAVLHLCQKSILDEQDIEQIYNEFKIDKGLAQPSGERPSYTLDQSFIPQPLEDKQPLILAEVGEAKGINAIVDNQKLLFGPKLTVIYGPNASGKSGYARILKASSFTRSPRIIIHGNVRLLPEGRPEISATFIFTDGSSIKFSQGKPCPQMQDNFAVFDSSCIRIYTDTKTNFNVSPYGFDIFPCLTKVVELMRTSLDKEIKERSPDLTKLQMPESSSRVAYLLNNLGVDTDVQELSKLQEFGPPEEAKMVEVQENLGELNQKDHSNLIKQKRLYGKNIKSLINNIRYVNEVLGSANLETIKNKIAEIKQLRGKSSAASAAQFGRELIQPVGTPTWIKLIEDAIRYHEEIFPGQSFPVDSSESRCVLCHQLLDDDAKKRLAKFFEFVHSDAEENLSIVLAALSYFKTKIKSLNLNFFDSETIIYQTVKSLDGNLSNEISEYLSKIKNLQESIIANITNEAWSFIPEMQSTPVDNCTLLRNNLAQDIRLLKKHNVSKEKSSLEEELKILSDRKQLNRIFSQVKKAIEDLKWIKKAQEVHRSLKRELTEITNKQKDLMSKLIGQGFKERFNIECSQLGLELPLQIDIRGSGAVTSKSISVGLATQLTPDPSEVLSEGEQTAVALADFLTELELNRQPIGIIFDDPVNSMDHIRKKLIAERLVEEATKRQVIIFTHDILFINSLANEAEKIGSKKIEFKGCTVSVDPNDKTPGYIDRTVFPNEYYEGNLRDQAEAYLKQAKQLAGKEQSEKLILGCGALRAAYENFIQKQMFHDVVARWRENIIATALPQIYYRQVVNDSVAERYGYLSIYEQGHSHSPEYHEVPLDCTVLENEIKKFDKITREYKKEADNFRREKSKKKKDVFS